MYLLVIGGNSDIGLAIAKKFHKFGYDIFLTTRDNNKTDHKIKNFDHNKTNIKYINFDLLDFNKHQSFYDNLEPKPDVVLCAAGIIYDDEDLIEKFDKVEATINTNYTAYVSILNIIIKDFKKRNRGSIIGISSVAGERGRGSNFVYGSTKAAFTAYLSGLRNALNKTNVNIITVKPGFIDTKMTKNSKYNSFLQSKPDIVARDVFNAWKKNKSVLYTPWYWKYIMLIIKLIPENIFQKLKL